MTTLVVTESDCIQEKSGEFSLTFTLPSTGNKLEVTALSRKQLVEIANHNIQADVRATEARPSYIEGITALSHLALTQSGSGAEVAAQLLLSTYNCSEFQLETARLSNLDSDQFIHAINVIKGRIYCCEEPQYMIENGQDIFEKLWERWKSLHVNRRYADWYK